MPSFKSDTSFFHKIAMGAIGSRAVKSDLGGLGHEIAELERGSLDAKIWKDQKRKRVRIPDLVCKQCGQRIEARAKSDPVLAMSHNPTVPERAWDHGMMGDDLIAVPICTRVEEEASAYETHWTRGTIARERSYWHEREWVSWQQDGAINYFTVDALRTAPKEAGQRKGAEEGSETTLKWKAAFAACDGHVQKISDSFITITPAEGRPMRTGRKNLPSLVVEGDAVRRYQVIAGDVVPVKPQSLQCPRTLSEQILRSMLQAKHMPIRFAGAKLSRLLGHRGIRDAVEAIANDRNEDLYARLEAKAYLAAVHDVPIGGLFNEHLTAVDTADRLEAVIAIGDVGNDDAVRVLAQILADTSTSYFLRSAAAYCLGRVESRDARAALIKAFQEQSHRVREDALSALGSAGYGGLADLLAGLQHTSEDIQAGCAEAIRWIAAQSEEAEVEAVLVPGLRDVITRQPELPLAVWLGGQLPETIMRNALAQVLDKDARLAFALAVLWSYSRSWIAPVHDTFIPTKK